MKDSFINAAFLVKLFFAISEFEFVHDLLT